MSAFGQTLNEILVNKISYADNDNCDWGAWEVAMDLQSKDSLVKKIKDSDFLQYPLSNFDEYHNKFKVVDFNLDGLLDLIYYGNPGGAESTFVYFMINKGDYFEVIFTSAGTIISLSNYDGFNSLGMTVYNYGCCAGIVDHLYTIVPISNGYNFYYQVQTDIAICNVIKMPSNFLDKPIRFETVNDKYSLRATPEINTEHESYSESSKGNIMVTYPKNSSGVAIAKSKDDTGRVWWFVVMSENNRILESKLYSGYHDLEKFKIVGWMSSRYVESLK